jgi:hypothetical protein
MSIDKAAELAKAMPKKDPAKLNKEQLLNLKLADEYTAAEPTDWDSPAPTSVQEAIDRLAAAVKAGVTVI